jgi:hypothetical protein
MVTGNENKQRVVDRIREWFGSLPQGTAELTEELTEYETIIRIKPSKSKACDIEFRIGNYGKFDVAMGNGIQFDEIPISLDLVVDICRSVAKGRVKERVWISNGKVVRSKGEVELSSDRWFDRGSNSWRGILGLGKVEDIHYEPYTRDEGV